MITIGIEVDEPVAPVGQLTSELVTTDPDSPGDTETTDPPRDFI